jgi:hypothetical protein
MRNIPVTYIYLDIEGIESLYAQIVNAIEVEITKSKGYDLNSKVAGKLGLSTLISKIFNAEVSSEITGSKNHNYEVKEVYSIEHKLEKLKKYLQEFDNKILFNDLCEAIKNCKINSQIYLNIEEKFNMPQFYGSIEYAISSVNNSKTVTYEIGEPINRNNMIMVDTYNNLDDYYKTLNRNKIRVVMSSSLDKMPRSRSGMGYIGHDAVFFRGFQGRNVPLKVFGTIVNINNGLFYQIKPYAIWI